MAGIPPKFRKLIRPVAGLIFFGLGLLFMFVPFIPLGYVFILIALLLFSYDLPFVNRLIVVLRKKDKGNNIKKIEYHIEKTERELENRIIDKEKHKSD